RADGFRRLRRADRDSDDLSRLARFPEPDRFLDPDLVERVHRHFHIAQFHPGTVCFYSDFDVVVDNTLDCNENLHAFTPAPACRVWLGYPPVNAPAFTMPVPRDFDRPNRAQ